MDWRCGVEKRCRLIAPHFHTGYKSVMSDNNDWRPVAFFLVSMLLFGTAIRLWFDMAAEESRRGKWGLGVFAAVDTTVAAVSLVFFFLFASGVLK